MARVRALADIKSAKGMMIAHGGDEGEALRNYPATRSTCFYKVAVRWNCRRKVYWVHPDQLEFVDSVLDARSYTAMPTGVPQNVFPAVPTEIGYNRYDFGANLRYYRLKKRLQQRELAERLSEVGAPVAQTTISNWERHKAAPSGRYVQAISEALDVPAFVFFCNLTDCRWINGTLGYIKRVRERMCKEEPL